MNEQYMMLAAIMLNNRNRNQDEYKQNPLSTREMYAVRKPRRSVKEMVQAVLAPVTTLKNRLPRRADGPAEQPRIEKNRQASMS
jgi:hypothetical protein